MLGVGLLKVGAPPALLQEYYGRTFAKLPVESIPDSLIFSVPGSIPVRPDGKEIHASVRKQIFDEQGQVKFRGWLQKDQRNKLLEHRDHLDWRCSVEKLFAEAQPEGPLAEKVAYYADHDALSFQGHMTQEQKDALLAFGGDDNWEAAVNELYDNSQAATSVEVAVDPLPPYFKGDELPSDVSFDDTSTTLTVRGPLTDDQKDALEDVFPVARPMDPPARTVLLDRIKARGPVASEQEEAFNKFLDGSWTVAQLRRVLDEAGAAEEEERTACEMFEDQKEGVKNIALTKIVGEDQLLNSVQIGLLVQFAADRMISAAQLKADLKEAGPFNGAQETALDGFVGTLPTEGRRDRDLCFAMMKARDAEDGHLTLEAAQRDLLLGGYRNQMAWRRAMGDLYVNAHTVKYPWSGEYSAQGHPFWWLYEYVFKPLQATTFAMLAFYVASAAFRAFRAKNVEAILLLGTAFIILLGRTFAGVFMTAWLPDWASGLKIENLSVYIMQVFNTAGGRAIMIGIALGVASTSLKVLLGVDRSYLGTGEE